MLLLLLLLVAKETAANLLRPEGKSADLRGCADITVLGGYDYVSAGANGGVVPAAPPLVFGSFTDTDPDVGEADHLPLT